MKRVLRFGLWIVGLIALLIAVAALVVTVMLRGSLAQLDDVVTTDGVSAPVRVERDAAGVPTIFAASRTDLYHAQGYIHAQERFFQMDLSRRLAAGRLSELFGERALDTDRASRVHGLSLVADEVVAQMPEHHKAQIDAYVRGVNEGVSALLTKPFEYFATSTQPEPWQARDCVLVLLAMFLDLTDEEAQLDRQRGLMFERLPAAVYDWLAAPGSAWDAPLAGPAFSTPPMPTEAWFSDKDSVAPNEAPTLEGARGSNSFAVGGALTEHGAALLANDMHLGLRVPNIWYRARLVEGDVAAPRLQVVGVSLPGAPGIIVGSNSHIAWGFTNSYGDYSDRIVLRTSGSAGRYRVPRGGDTLRVREEVIEVKDGAAVRLSVPMTRYGPVVAEDANRRPVAVRWLAHFAEAVNFGLLDMLDVTEIDSALALAPRLGIPPQNILLTTKDGHVAWTIAGRLPRRVGYDPSRPVFSDQDGGWRGWLRPHEYPVIIDPPSGRLWTANARVAHVDDVAAIGLGNYPLGARAGQIRDQLFAREQFDEGALLDVALDSRGLFLERWRTLMRSVLTREAIEQDPARRALLEQLSRGSLHAATDSMAYRSVREFRSQIVQDLYGEWLQPLSELPDVRISRLRQREGPAWVVVSTQPAHLLPGSAKSWSTYFLGVIDQVVERLPPTSAASTWGAQNMARIRHPLAGALPTWLQGSLSMPAQPLPGDRHMPRVQGVGFGASQRLVVAPGREEHGLFHMPTGQSGHPLSPFFRAGHDDWVDGNPSPLLPGPTRYTLTFTPTRED